MISKLMISVVLICFVFLMVGSCRKYDIGSAKVVELKDAKVNANDLGNKNVYTTVDRVVLPDGVISGKVIKPWDVSLFSTYNYGKWHFGHGYPHERRLDLMPAGYNLKSDKKAASLLRFFTMTDIHITDKESPAQTIEYSLIPGLFFFSISCYSPSMLFSTHVLNAAIQTINDINRQNPLDFGIALGDMSNTSIYNEFRWFIDLFDGKNINPDSGKKDDPIPGPANDYQDKYQAEGLCKSIPWYATIGNHDHFFIGAKKFNGKVRKNLIGRDILQMGNAFTQDNALDLNTYSMGTLDGSTVTGEIIGAGVVADMKNIPTIPADLNRRALTKVQVMKEFSNTTTIPRGHGFNQPNIFDGCYTFEPKSDLPVRVIVLDDTMDESENPPTGSGYGCGSLGNGRFEWLIRQLQAGQREDKLMIIAAHIPFGVVAPKSMLGWIDGATQNELITELKKYPNFMLWLSGHRHFDTVTSFPSGDQEHPENGFWEVETRSLREFPQQFRTIEIMRNGDNSISILATDVDTDISHNAFAALSRTYAIAAYQSYDRPESPLPTNVELVKKLTPRMQNKISKYKRS